MTKQSKEELRTVTANEYTNVKDVKGNFLYTKDGYAIIYLRVFPYNLDLVANAERRAKTDVLSASFDGDRKNFDYFSVPRELDLDDYKTYLSNAYQSEQDGKYSLGRRKILRVMLKEAHLLSTSGENYEHQHFMKLWAFLGSTPKDACHSLLERAEEFRQRYDAVGIKTEILDEVNIIKVCNLFGNGSQAPYESFSSDDIDYISLAVLRE